MTRDRVFYSRGMTIKRFFQYDKPDWYYYLYNIMSTNKKNDLLVDDATVQHPKDVRGVLIKVWIHFYTEEFLQIETKIICNLFD